MRRFALAVARLLVRLLPPALRREHGAEMEDTLRERLGRGGPVAAGREWADLATTAGREWAGLGVSWVRGRVRGGGGGMSGLLQDLKHGVRGLLKRPGFTSVTVLTLAVGIGTTTAIYTVVDGVLLRSLPFPDSRRLAFVWGGPLDPGQHSTRWWTSWPDYRDYEEAQTAFQELTAFRSASATLTGGGHEPATRPTAQVSWDLFRTVGIQPALGRAFTTDDDRVGAAPVVILSNALAREWYGPDADPLGRSLEVDGVAHTVVGVMAPGFDFPEQARLWVPLAPVAGQDSRGMHRIILVGRLAPGTDVAEASRQVYGIAQRLSVTYPDTNAEQGAWAEPLLEAYVGNVRATLLILLGATVVVLLVACANVANLFLARTTGRTGEVAIRTALGAGRARVLRPLLGEAVLVALTGGAAGVALAWAGVRGLVRLAPAGVIPRADEIRVDGGVLAVAAAVTLGTVLLFGLVPALRAARRDVADLLRENGGRSGGDARGGRLRGLLVVGETALAMALVVSGGLLVRSFVAVSRVDPGFRPADMVVLPVSLPTSRYPLEQWRPIARFFRELQRRAGELPGVESAAVAYAHPLDPSWTTSFWFPDRPEPEPGRRPEASYRPVSPGYFRTAGIPVLRGRGFLPSDDADAPGVVVVNQSFAREFFPGQDPVGRRLQNGTWWDGTPEGEWTIVGLVADVKFDGLERPTPWAVYYAHAQRPMSDMDLIVRARDDVAAVVPGLRGLLHEMDPDLPAEDIRGMDRILADATASRRFTTILLTGFGAVAALLAAVGLYGVLAYSVSRRRHELGVRLSLGATGGRVVRMVVAQGIALAAVGVVLGLGLALLSGRLLESLLFEVSRSDPLTFAVVGSGLLAVAFLASAIPARRATRVDPVGTLRAE